MTYYLLGKAGKTTPPTAQVSPVLGVSAMETVTEEDESRNSQKSDEKGFCDEGFCGDTDGTTSTQPLIVDEAGESSGAENSLLLNGGL